MKCLKSFKIVVKSYKGLNVKDIFKQNTDEFCRNTTLHGLKYVADNELNSCDRYFFGLSVLTVICLAFFLILRVYNKWSTSPIIVGINPEPTFITNEPFPAVTICNLNQALASKAKQFSKNSPEYAKLQLLCKRKVNVTVVETITNWNTLDGFIENISQPCEDLLVHCRFGGRDYNCTHLFYPLVTAEGLCCVFNMLHPKYMYVASPPKFYNNRLNLKLHQPIDWYSEGGYPKNLPKFFFPRKAPGVGESVGLSITLDVQQDKYYCSSSNSVGFKVALHSPNESPNIRETGVFVEHGKETKLRIRPVKTESDKHLKSINKHYRHCLFHSEGNLKFFAHYTQRNCELECVADVSLQYCGCVSYFMPRVNENISVCSIYDVNCEQTVLLRKDDKIKSCLDDCLPSCYDLNFEVDSFSTKLAYKRFDLINSRLMNMSPSYIEDNIAVVHMYFKENSFRSSIQTEFIGLPDFLSSIGGLMGLFVGFSFVSIAELIYFAIIRPYRALNKFKKSKDIYNHLENGSNAHVSSSKLRTSRKSCKQRYKRRFSSFLSSTSTLKLQHDHQHRLFEVKQQLPFLISNESEKNCKRNIDIWLE